MAGLLSADECAEMATWANQRDTFFLAERARELGPVAAAHISELEAERDEAVAALRAHDEALDEVRRSQRQYFGLWSGRTWQVSEDQLWRLKEIADAALKGGG